MKDCVFDFCVVWKVKGESNSAKGLMEVYLGKKFKWHLI